MANCKFDKNAPGGKCVACGFMLLRSFGSMPVRQCTALPCRHLGEVATRAGVTVMVKCNCPKAKGEIEQFLPAYSCGIKRRCLPTAIFNQEQADKWHARPEAELYAVCQDCDSRS